MPIHKAAAHQLGQGRVQAAQCRAMLWGRHRAGRGSHIWEASHRNALLNRGRLAIPQPLGAEGVVSVHEKLEDQHAQAKRIVFGLTVDPAHRYALQLGRGIFVFSYRARVQDHLPVYLFLYATSFWQVLALGALTMLPNTFLNPSFQAMFTDMVPREKRGRMIAALGGGGVWFMGGAWGTGVIAMLSMTAGSLLSGYVYRFNSSLPWVILSASLVLLGVLFITQIKESDKVED